MNAQARFVLRVVTVFLLLGSIAPAQIETARITGTISDSTGAVIRAVRSSRPRQDPPTRSVRRPTGAAIEVSAAEHTV